MNFRILISAMVAMSAGLLVTACEPNAPSARDVEAKKGMAAANSIKFETNAERDNIVKRLKRTSDPGMIGFVLLLNEAGQPIAYLNVIGKITSGGKRLTPPMEYYCPTGAATCGWQPAPSDEGTYGSSNPYVFFFTTDDQYFQWSGHYLYSDKPFRINAKPLVVNIVEQPKPDKG